MRLSRISGCAGLLWVILLGACGPSPEQQAAEEAKRRLEEASKQMEAAAHQVEEASKQGGASLGQALSALGAAAGASSAKIEPVDFRELKALLPPELGGLPRKTFSGEKAGVFGIVTSNAEATYQVDGKPGSLHLKITDPGTLTGLSALGALWMNAEIDKESDSGYEKTGTMNGRRYHEQYNKTNKQGDFAVIAGNRFIVELNGYDVDMATLKQAIGKIDLAKLDSMKVANGSQ